MTDPLKEIKAEVEALMKEFGEGPQLKEAILKSAKVKGGIVRDVTKKCIDDVMRAMATPLELCADEAGPLGIYIVSERVAAFALIGAAMAFQTARTNEAPTKDNTNQDDVLFCALTAYMMNEDTDKKPKGTLSAANDLFEKIRGYRHKVPDLWIRADRENSFEK